MARRHVQRSQRKSLWLQFQQFAVTNAGNSSSIAFSLNTAALALRPFTLVRSHFSFYLTSDQAAAVETQAAFVGMAVVSEQAVTVGITAVPTPNTEMASSLWFALKLMYGNAVNLTDQTSAGKYFELDSKAMRKVELGQDIIVVIENPIAAGHTLQLAGRMLIKTN